MRALAGGWSQVVALVADGEPAPDLSVVALLADGGPARCWTATAGWI